jgi:hypothetical protein
VTIRGRSQTYRAPATGGGGDSGPWVFTGASVYWWDIDGLEGDDWIGWFVKTDPLGDMAGFYVDSGPADLNWLNDIVVHLHFTGTGTAHLLIALPAPSWGNTQGDRVLWHRLTSGLITPSSVTAHFDRDGNDVT